MAQVTLPPCFLVAGAACAAGAVAAAGAVTGFGASVGFVAGAVVAAAADAGAAVGAAGLAAAVVGAAAGAAGWHAASSCALNAAPAVMPMARSTARRLIALARLSSVILNPLFRLPIHCRVALAGQS